MICKLCCETKAISVLVETYDGEDIPVCAQCLHAYERGQASPDAHSMPVEDYEHEAPHMYEEPPAWMLGQDPDRCETCGTLLQDDERGHAMCPGCDGEDE